MVPEPSTLKRNLATRARIIDSIRGYFRRHDFLEVETPVRMPNPAPEAYIDPVTSEDWYLSTSPELHMKRLLADGYSRIFQISRCFRRGERGRLHNPEFTMLEWYRTGADYSGMAQDVEGMVGDVCVALGVGRELVYQDVRLDLRPPWPRLTVAEAYQSLAGWTPGADPDTVRFDLDMVQRIEPAIGRNAPCVLCDYPAAMGSLARLKPGNRAVAERLEIYAGGLELANAYTELTDAAEQRRRFVDENTRRLADGRSAIPLPERFLSIVDAIPEAGGCALGLDRLVMLFCDAASIDEVMAFNQETA